MASPWLIAPLQDRLADLDDDIDDAKPKLDNVVTAVQVAPAMLGADGERRYFIAFTTPAETRGLGGFMGNWAELTANDGRLAIADFGTHGRPRPGRRDARAPAGRSTGRRSGSTCGASSASRAVRTEGPRRNRGRT